MTRVAAPSTDVHGTTGRTSLEVLSRAFAARGQPLGNGRHGRYNVRCPAHDDGRPSLSIRIGDQGRALLFCHAGCRYEDVLNALGLSASDLFIGPVEASPKKQQALQPTYVYSDESGVPLFGVVRKKTGKARFFLAHPTPDGWVKNRGDAPKVLYNLPGVIEAVQDGRIIWACEGERDADTATRLGFCGTTAVSGHWAETDLSPLAGAVVLVIADNDKAGLTKAWERREVLEEAGIAIDPEQVVRPRLPDNDLTDLSEAAQNEPEIVLEELVPCPLPDEISGFVRDELTPPHRVRRDGRHYYGMISTLVMEDERLRAEHLAFYALLLCKAQPTTTAHITLEAAADQLGGGRNKMSVTAARLEEVGLVERLGRGRWLVRNPASSKEDADAYQRRLTE